MAAQSGAGLLPALPPRALGRQARVSLGTGWWQRPQPLALQRGSRSLQYGLLKLVEPWGNEVPLPGWVLHTRGYNTMREGSSFSLGPSRGLHATSIQSEDVSGTYACRCAGKRATLDKRSTWTDM